MKTVLRHLVLLLLIVSVSRCTDPLSPTSSSLTEDASAFTESVAKAPTSFTAGSYEVRFDGRTVQGGSTTFAYTLAGTGQGEDVSHFTVELPSCAPAPSSFAPTGGVSINSDPVTGLYGIDWHLKVTSTGSQSYSVTFPGDVPLGIVSAAVRGGDDRFVGQILGPCANVFDVSGLVYADSDGDGSRDPQESGIAGVTVELVDDAGSVVRAVVTSTSGSYLFDNQFAGTYTARVPDATAAADFNEELFDSFSYTGSGAAEHIVELTSDSAGNDFGFDVQISKLIGEFDNDVLTSTAEDARYWATQFKGRGNVEIAPAMLQGYLDAIESLFQPEPFQFSDADELAHAFAILSNNSRDDLDKLAIELLTAELNLVSGRTIDNAAGLLEGMIAWSEGVYAENSAQALAKATSSTGDVEEASALLRSFNTTGGGGSNE